MSNNKTIVVQWGTNIPGRESIGLETFLGVSQYYQGLVKDSKLGNFQTILFENGSFDDVAGLMILTGSEQQITDVLNSDKHRENLTKGVHVVNNVRVQTGWTGDEIPNRVQEVTKWRKDLGL